MVQPWGPGCPLLALSPPEPWPPGPHAPRPRWAQSPLGLGLLFFQKCGCISLVGSGPGHTWATRNQKASRPESGLHPRVGGRGSKLPTRSRKSEVVVTYIMNTKMVIDTHSHTQGHTLTCSQAHSHLHWAFGPARRDPVLHLARLWAGPWAGRGRAGPHQMLSNQSRHRVPGAGTDQGEWPRGIGPAAGSAHVGSAGLEGGERVLELFIQKTDTSQAANA